MPHPLDANVEPQREPALNREATADARSPDSEQCPIYSDPPSAKPGVCTDKLLLTAMPDVGADDEIKKQTDLPHDMEYAD